jgi:hypothetical protein
MSERSFFSRIFGRAVKDETKTYSAEEIGAHRPEDEELEEEWQPQGFNVERAAEIIDDLPPEVPRESAVRIVRGTLVAAGIRVENLERSTRAREAKLNSEMELARNRQRKLQEETERVERSLEEEIRKAREARDTGVAEEKERISRAAAGLESLKRVRAFFGFPEPEEEIIEQAGDPTGDETQALEAFDTDETQVMQRFDPLAEKGGPDDMTSEDSLPHPDPSDTTDER